ncbi:hypothetical protein CJ179_38905 [Rhodococcus sp. ACS1]|uniref:hypothetical protein n=1 Tax=Rhodococcus sp. ACS1 TaxID=2028570 RepID=UPI000BB0D327|nr:hypothetical protein [Rhodococcus sp. ACS1]PBC38567.1 hypothetical protein CJ179_38905 [Rhodococcus sp. ACS1]
MTTATRTRPVASCGTDAGYQRHRRHSTPVCDDCQQAHNEYEAKWRARKAAGIAPVQIDPPKVITNAQIWDADCKWLVTLEFDGTWKAQRRHLPTDAVLSNAEFFPTKQEANWYTDYRIEGYEHLAALGMVMRRRVEKVRAVSLKKQQKVSLKRGPQLDIDAVLENSYKNFHTKGFDYICLKRSDRYTQKLYFFDGDVSSLPEVVNPHDHRYDFATTCIAGEVENVLFERSIKAAYNGEPALRYEVFKYRTPLNGGNGFEWFAESMLRETSRVAYKPGETYLMKYNQLHTIRMVKPETVIMLEQFEDRIPLTMPTRTYVRGKTPPSLDGLYDRFTADEIIARLTRLKERVPTFELPEF